jgi:integrase/recombinase XerD
MASVSGRPRKKKHDGTEGWDISKYPFMRDALAYLRSVVEVFAPSTLKETERRLRRMNKDLVSLKESGTIDNIATYALREKDILAYLKLLRSRGLHDSGICHNVDTLSSVMRFIGNPAMERARAKHRQHFPKRGSKRYDPIPTDGRQKIIGCANKMSDNDWYLMVAYGLAVTAICTGLRPKELRLATICDYLDLNRGTLHTQHVKGEGSYGNARDSAIHPEGIPFLRRYVKARDDWLAKEGLTRVEAMFPAIQNIHKGGDGHFASNSLTKLRARVTADSGVTFDLRACRRTFGQVNVNMGVPWDTVSLLMGHATTTTTEKYYCRKPNEWLFSRLKRYSGITPY